MWQSVWSGVFEIITKSSYGLQSYQRLFSLFLFTGGVIDHIADLDPEVGHVPDLGQSREVGQAQEADRDHRVACLVAGR